LRFVRQEIVRRNLGRSDNALAQLVDKFQCVVGVPLGGLLFRGQWPVYLVVVELLEGCRELVLARTVLGGKVKPLLGEFQQHKP
jgi:hypothetical protein